MTTTYKGIKPGSRTASTDGSVRTYSEVHIVTSDSASDGPYAVGSTTGLPLIGTLHSEDPSAWCRSLSVTNPEPYAGWEVAAEFSSLFEINEDPSQDSVRISYDGEKYERPLVKDYNGDPVEGNSAGDPYDPPNMIDDARGIWVFEKNLASIPSFFKDAENAVNNDSLTIGGLAYTARQLKMDVVRASTVLERNGTPFITATITMHYRKETWDFQNPDLGFRQLNDEGKLVDIVSEGDGSPVSNPALLDGNGKAIINPQPGDAVIRTVRGYPETTFATILSALGL